MKNKIIMVLVISSLLCAGFVLPAVAQTVASTNADITFDPGSLTMTHMPTFTFGTQQISANPESYKAKEALVFLNVSDLRGSGDGWKVAASVSKFTSGAADTLAGSSISFSGGTTVPFLTGKDPEVKDVVLACDGGANKDIVVAPRYSGLGAWSVKWSGADQANDSVTLNVLGGAATSGVHTATISWSLYNAP